MAYREKIAWLELASMALAYGGYFIAVAALGGARDQPFMLLIGLFAAASAIRVLILGVGYMSIKASTVASERGPRDERDRALARRGAAAGYYVLLAGMILVGMILPFTAQGWAIVNAALFAIVLAETVSYGTAVFGYRRGWQ